MLTAPDGEDFHVELLLEAGTKSLLAVHLEAVLSLIREAAVPRRIGRTWKGNRKYFKNLESFRGSEPLATPPSLGFEPYADKGLQPELALVKSEPLKDPLYW